MTALDDPASRSIARTAGSLYLIIAAADFFSILGCHPNSLPQATRRVRRPWSPRAPASSQRA